MKGLVVRECPGTRSRVPPGEVAVEHHKEGHAQAPEVHRDVVVPPVQKLRRHVGRRPHRPLGVGAPFLGDAGGAKVRDPHLVEFVGLKLLLGVDQNILQLQVAVNDVAAVHVLHALHELLHHMPRLDLLEPALLAAGHRLEQIAFGQVHDEAGPLALQVNRQQPDHARVGEELHNLHLAVKAIHQVFLVQLGDLHCEIRRPVAAHVDSALRALAQAPHQAPSAEVPPQQPWRQRLLHQGRGLPLGAG
mmetsp:Transcript_71401/g.170571  ORF Transcript_71401/g.170571 Transcript_71401/m.170571 type:complete len:247 (-) Transcript_71401:64-804(-)